jgi:ribulose-5-phosphate 4-epimerase/fuculose-1-phosphate aldolase
MKEIIELYSALRIADALGFSEGINNHFSIIHPAKKSFFLNPLGVMWSEVLESDIVEVDFSRNIIGNRAVEDTAFFIHSNIHKINKSANVILHMHSPYTTAITCTQEGRLLPLSQTSLQFYERICYVDDYQGFIENNEDGLELAKKIGNYEIVFLKNHGVIVIGATIHQAIDDLYFLERAAELQYLVLSANQKPNLIVPEICKKTVEQFKNTEEIQRLHYQALCRKYL